MTWETIIGATREAELNARARELSYREEYERSRHVDRLVAKLEAARGSTGVVTTPARVH